MTDTSSSFTRLTFEVPSPWTLMTVGKRRTSAEKGVQWSGVSVNTDDHVRLFALGDESSSDVVGQADDRVWLQARKNVNMLAEKTVVVGSMGRTYLASGDGTLIMAGFSTAPVRSQDSPDDTPRATSAYLAKARVAGGIWSGFDAAMAVVNAITSLSTAAMMGEMSWAPVAKALVTTIGVGANIIGFTGSQNVSLPGLSLFSEGGTFVTSVLGGINIHATLGLTLGGIFQYNIGYATVKMRGFSRASMTATDTVDVASALWHETKTDGPQTYAARTGDLSLRGAKLLLGIYKSQDSKVQMPTDSVLFTSLSKTSITANLGVSFDTELTGTATLEAGTDITMQAVDAVTFDVGGFEVVVSRQTVHLCTPVGDSLDVTPGVVTLKGEGVLGKSSLTCDGSTVLAKSNGHTFEVTPSTQSVRIDGTELKIG
ncbi:MAG: hypothetical protein H6719_29155 [Sandaracinaceae bacterium]|nr:hypothetical protein [Sandaracinaceae bacterium]